MSFNIGWKSQAALHKSAHLLDARQRGLATLMTHCTSSPVIHFTITRCNTNSVRKRPVRDTLMSPTNDASCERMSVAQPSLINTCKQARPPQEDINLRAPSFVMSSMIAQHFWMSTTWAVSMSVSSASKSLTRTRISSTPIMMREQRNRSEVQQKRPELETNT